MSNLLTVASYNINRSPLILDTLLSSPTLSNYDALLLQEPPCRIPSHTLPKRWTLLLPTPNPSRNPTTTGLARPTSSPPPPNPLTSTNDLSPHETWSMLFCQ
ncbi:hypothetical protein JCM11251_007764 [Rhodosporidiobolus azoricus]